MKTIAERYAFFKENAGYRTDGHRPSGTCGAATCAMGLARAEATAERLGLWVHWTECDLEWDGDCEPPKYCLDACVYRAEDNENDERATAWEGPSPKRGAKLLASLGMIGFESRRDLYLRVVTAELFSEALDELDGEFQDEADKLAERATYAAGIAA